MDKFHRKRDGVEIEWRSRKPMTLPNRYDGTQEKDDDDGGCLSSSGINSIIHV